MLLARMMREFSKETIIEKARKITMDIKNMPYYKNYAAASGAVHNISNQEDEVAEMLIKNELTDRTKSNIMTNRASVSDWLKNPRNAVSMPPMSFISQPCGTHDSPDFLVKLEHGVVFGIECKSSDGYCPMYNSGGIKQNLIYVLSSKKKNQTTVYVGRDIMTIAQQNLINELIQKQKVLEKEYNEKLKAIDIHHRGINYGTRPAIQQAGGESYTNYFIHSEREMCEQNVDLFLDEIIDSAYSE